MRSRPDVDVKVPRVAHPGDKVPIEVLIEPLSETPIDFVDLIFSGEEVQSLAVDGQQAAEKRPIVERRERLIEKGTLVPGALRHSVQVKIPESAPASYMGVRGTIQYHVRIHVSIPWWPDLDESTEITIEPLPTPRPKPSPVTKSARRGASAKIELSLADTAFAIGDEISGAFAVGDLSRSDGLGVEISLVGIEASTQQGRTRRSERTRYIVPSVLRAPGSGAEVPFRFRVPKEAFPSFKTPMCELSWLVQASVSDSTGRGVSVTAPVTIGPFGAPTSGSADRPRIGAEKWREIWRTTGEEHGLSLARGRLALTGARGDVRVEIARDDESDTPALTATFDYPSLEIGLEVRKRRLLLGPTAVEARLGNHHRVESRVPEQANAFFTRRLVESLRRFDEVSLGDARGVVRNKGSGLEAKSLSNFILISLSLAKSLTEASNAIPPPAEMEDHLPAWQSFAASTGAVLAIGGMTLFRATVDGATLDIATDFFDDGTPVATEIRMELDPPLERAYSLKEPDPWAPPGARELAQILRQLDATLTIETGQMKLRIPSVTPDPSDLRTKMGEMLLLVRRLRGERTPGPYR